MSDALQGSSQPCAGLSLPVASCHLLCTCQERGGWLPCHTSLLALEITAEMYSSLSASKLELKIERAGVPAIQVTSMGACPACLLLAAGHSVGVSWLACACHLAVSVCHLFAVFSCLQTQSNPGSTRSALQQVLAVVQLGTGGCLGSRYCSDAEHCPGSCGWCLWQCRLQLRARLQPHHQL